MSLLTPPHSPPPPPLKDKRSIDSLFPSSPPPNSPPSDPFLLPPSSWSIAVTTRSLKSKRPLFGGVSGREESWTVHVNVKGWGNMTLGREEGDWKELEAGVRKLLEGEGLDGEVERLPEFEGQDFTDRLSVNGPRDRDRDRDRRRPSSPSRSQRSPTPSTTTNATSKSKPLPSSPASSLSPPAQTQSLSRRKSKSKVLATLSRTLSPTRHRSAILRTSPSNSSTQTLPPLHSFSPSPTPPPFNLSELGSLTATPTISIDLPTALTSYLSSLSSHPTIRISQPFRSFFTPRQDRFDVQSPLGGVRGVRSEVVEANSGPGAGSRGSFRGWKMANGMGMSMGRGRGRRRSEDGFVVVSLGDEEVESLDPSIHLPSPNLLPPLSKKLPPPPPLPAKDTKDVVGSGLKAKGSVKSVGGKSLEYKAELGDEVTGILGGIWDGEEKKAEGKVEEKVDEKEVKSVNGDTSTVTIKDAKESVLEERVVEASELTNGVEEIVDEPTIEIRNPVDAIESMEEEIQKAEEDTQVKPTTTVNTTDEESKKIESEIVILPPTPLVPKEQLPEPSAAGVGEEPSESLSQAPTPVSADDGPSLSSHITLPVPEVEGEATPVSLTATEVEDEVSLSEQDQEHLATEAEVTEAEAEIEASRETEQEADAEETVDVGKKASSEVSKREGEVASGVKSKKPRSKKARKPKEGIEEVKEKKKVTLQDFEIVKVLGKGCAGKVLLVKHSSTKQRYAMKSIHKHHVLAHRELQHTLTEQSVLKRVAREEDNPFVVRMWFSFHDKDHLFLVLSFYPGGDLATQLARWGRLGRDRARFYAAEIVEGTVGLHKAGVIYRDLKPENILIAADGHVVLTDFGLSKQFERKDSASLHDRSRKNSSTDEVKPHWMKHSSSPPTNSSSGAGAGWVVEKERETTTTFCGTAEYLAPEVLLGEKYGYEVDWWSFGTMLYEMLTGLTPFWSEDHSTMYRRVLHDELSFEETDPRVMDGDTRSLIRGLLQKVPQLRMTDQRIKKHPYFSMIDWSHVYHKRYIPPYIPTLNPDDELDTQNFDETFLKMAPQVLDDEADQEGENGESEERDPPTGEPQARYDENGKDVFDGYSYIGPEWERESVWGRDESEDGGDESGVEGGEEGDAKGEDSMRSESTRSTSLNESSGAVNKKDGGDKSAGGSPTSLKVVEEVLEKEKVGKEANGKEDSEKEVLKNDVKEVEKAKEKEGTKDSKKSVNLTTPSAVTSKPISQPQEQDFTADETEELVADMDASNITSVTQPSATTFSLAPDFGEGDDWDMVTDADREEKNGSRGATLFARGVVDKYRLLIRKGNGVATPARRGTGNRKESEVSSIEGSGRLSPLIPRPGMGRSRSDQKVLNPGMISSSTLASGIKLRTSKSKPSLQTQTSSNGSPKSKILKGAASDRSLVTEPEDESGGELAGKKGMLKTGKFKRLTLNGGLGLFNNNANSGK